jgi:hypothetical protein
VRIGFIVLGSVLAAGCNGLITSGGSSADDGADASIQESSLAIVSPANGSTFVRDELSAIGALVAELDIEVTTDGPIDHIEVYAGDTMLGDALALATEVSQDGPLAIRAVAYDANDTVIAEASVDVTIEAPQAADCYEWLDLYQLDYSLGPANEGVDQPVTVTTPINGMPYRYFYSEEPRQTFFMHCELALSLARAAPHLHQHDIVEVLDIGVYNYRCIGGGEPPDCPNGISQHAYAKAIDIAGFLTSDDAFYSVDDDWVIDGDGEATCTAVTENEKDAFLHEVICELKDDDVWNIVLTPNYNDAHRNHFHVDLTTGSDYIRREVEPGVIPVVAAGSVCGTH